MFEVVSTTAASVLPYVVPLMFAMQTTATIAHSAKQPQPDRLGVQLFEPTESSLSHSRPEALIFEITESSISDLRSHAQRYATSQSSTWARSAIEKIETYADATDGWRGEGSHAPSAQTLRESAELLLQIAGEMPYLFGPLISVDDDGFACLYWNCADFVATISVYGDGTYSFFSEGYGITARSDSTDVGAILPQDLIGAMTGQIAFETTIAA